MRLLINPLGGRGRVRRRLDELTRLAHRDGLEVEVPEDRHRLAAQARRAAADGEERLLVAGGDGTIHWAAQGLAGSGTALAVLPLGTGNDLAEEIGVPSGLEAALEVAREGAVRRIDLLRVRERYVTGAVSAGFDGAVSERASRMRTPLPPKLVYPLAALLTWRAFRPSELRAELDGEVVEGRVLLIACANSPRYGGGLRIAPEARLDDGLADLVLVRPVSFATFLRLFPQLYRGGHAGHPAVEFRRTRAVRLGSDPPLRLWGDGEPLLLADADGVEVTVQPGSLRIVAPA